MRKIGTMGAATKKTKLTSEQQRMERIRAKIADYYFSKGDIVRAQETTRELMEECVDPRVRIRAAELMIKTNLEVQKYEEPPTQKLEHTGGLKLNIKIDNVDV